MADSQSQEMPASGPAGAGVFTSLRSLLVTLLGIAGTRFELIGVEVAEEKERLVGLLLTGLAAAFALAFAVLLATLFCVVLFWDSHRLAVIGAFVALYAGGGAWLALRLRAQLKSHPPMFAATLAELDKDREALRATLKRPAAP